MIIQETYKILLIKLLKYNNLPKLDFLIMVNITIYDCHGIFYNNKKIMSIICIIKTYPFSI